MVHEDDIKTPPWYPSTHENGADVAPSLCTTLETDKSFHAGGKQYVFTHLLGEGSFGQVFRCLCTPVGETTSDENPEFAVKVINACRIAVLCGQPVELVLPRMLREVDVLRQIGAHKNIVTLHDYYVSPASCKLYLVYELLHGGDLFNAIVARRRGFGESDACHILTQLAKAVSFGHDYYVAHRDIKLENCLLKSTSDLSIKLCDYGQAKVLKTRGCSAKTLTTTVTYTAPDVHSAVETNQSYDAYKADAFSLGILLFALLSGTLLKAPRGSEDLKKTRVWNSLSNGARNLIEGLLEPDPVDRLSVQGILKHPWVVAGGKDTARLAIVEPRPRRSASKTKVDAQVKALISVNQVVVAVQRERGLCMGALSDKEIVAQFVWQTKYTDQRIAEATSSLSEAINSEVKPPEWMQLSNTLASIAVALAQLRYLPQCSTGPPIDSDIEHLFAAYTDVLSQLIEEMSNVVQSLRPAERGSIALAELRFKMLMLMSEQLGRERAFVCGRLKQSEGFLNPRYVHEIIGARKCLFGTSSGSNVTVASKSGLPAAIDLFDASPLEDNEIAMLEDAENRALAVTTDQALACLEWYDLMTKLIDKVHQGVIMNLVALSPAFACTPDSFKLSESPPVKT